MDDYVHEYVAGDEVAAADLNGIQDQAASLLQVSGSWRGRRPTLESDGADVVVGAHDGFAAGTTQANAVFVPAAGRTAVTLGTLANNTWYCVYARNNAGAVTYSVEAYASAPPNSAVTHKNSDRGRIYIGCFTTDGAATPRAFMMVGGVYTYRHAMAALIAVTGAATPFTDVDLAAHLPAHALVAVMYAIVTAGAVTDYGLVRTNGSSVVGLPLYRGSMAFDIETDAVQKIEYDVNTATNVALYVTGFRE